MAELERETGASVVWGPRRERTVSTVDGGMPVGKTGVRRCCAAQIANGTFVRSGADGANGEPTAEPVRNNLQE